MNFSSQTFPSAAAKKGNVKFKYRISLCFENERNNTFNMAKTKIFDLKHFPNLIKYKPKSEGIAE